MSSFTFRITAEDSSTGARTGLAVTPHGAFETPNFMPVATHGAVKGLEPAELRAAGVQILLANAFHLGLRPGAGAVRSLGGVHGFSGFDGPILTDSGGYQVFSLADANVVTDEGVRFRSPIDGSELFVTPEESIRAQRAIGADLVMAFDECPPAGAAPEVVRRAADRTLAWAERSLAAFDRGGPQAILGIVQGGTDLALRTECAGRIAALPFDSFAIGGVGVGEEKGLVRSVVEHTAPLLPRDRLRYLMGIGLPGDFLHAVGAGVDLFDCVVPSRNGRNGTAFTSRGLVRIRNAAHALDPGPLDPDCPCATCRGGPSRAFLRHLFATGDHLGGALLTRHNVAFFEAFLAGARNAIRSGGFGAFRARWQAVYPT